ncbi:carboxypeptidase-like regulatory domain-containing protein [Streptomyces sp. YIM 130001]|uniref:carboxypeptidase-like regulatory domain-containing protein n=1 Tax=Streptomyces sp. YIM 130001 TaxID=2259644 RepID=UPI001F08A289|nr:carboxypeptidase-like regulatory domain-containing protein [Streptomyces sp. YIM 130001]
MWTGPGRWRPRRAWRRKHDAVRRGAAACVVGPQRDAGAGPAETGGTSEPDAGLVPGGADAGVASAVFGLIRSPQGEPVQGATLTLFGPSGARLDRVDSLADGSYIVSVPGAGRYDLVVSAPGSTARSFLIEVGTDPLVYDVELPVRPAGEADAVT